MESIFTLPYPEYVVAALLQKRLKKKEGYSVQIPLSRQQKGLDLLVYNQKTKKAISIQIKSSRSWQRKPAKRKNVQKFQHGSWFHKFDCKKGIADFYAFFILHPIGKFSGKRLDKTKASKKWWGYKVVIFKDKEMRSLLKKIKTRKGKPELFFGFGFNDGSKDVYVTRGLPEPTCYTSHLFEHKVGEIRKALSSKR